MPLFSNNILPAYSMEDWQLSNASVDSSGSLILGANGAAVFLYNVTEYSATGYMLFSCASCTGDAFITLQYQSNDEDTLWYSHTIKITSPNMYLPIVLLETETEQLRFAIYSGSGATVAQVYAQLEEQAIRSVDIEYASGTSQTIPPEDGWSSTPPEWQTNRYIWQRTATTFVDGHTEYSDPICLQGSDAAGISNIVEEYYLSTSSTEVTGGSWSETCPEWVSGSYIWTRSRIEWTDQTVTYTDPVLAQALNQANERVEEAFDAVEDLDTSLTQEEIFNRLTNNGVNQGLYLDNGSVYLNASYIQTGVLLINDPTAPNEGFIAYFSADPGEVYIAGFMYYKNYFYAGGCSGLNTPVVGVYIGMDGITVGRGDATDPNYTFITLRQGSLFGGTEDAGDVGYLCFDRKYNSTPCTALISYDNLILSASTMYVSDTPPAPGYTTTIYRGRTNTPTTNQEVALMGNIMDHGIAYDFRLSGSNVMYELYFPDSWALTTRNGLVTSSV